MRWHFTGRYELLRLHNIKIKGVTYAFPWEWIFQSKTALGKSQMYVKRVLKRGVDQKFKFMGHRNHLEGRIIKKIIFLLLLKLKFG